MTTCNVLYKQFSSERLLKDKAFGIYHQLMENEIEGDNGSMQRNIKHFVQKHLYLLPELII